MADDIVLCQRYVSDFDAELSRTLLESENISAMVMRDDAGGMDPQFQLTLGVRLMVRREDLERAKEILGAVEGEE